MHKKCIAILATLACPHAALALDNHVFSPDVVKGEFELEYGGTRTLDSDKAKNDVQKNEFEMGYGVTDWWQAELGGSLERGPGEFQDFQSSEFENTFEFTPPGKYWADVGMLATYHFAAKRDGADSVETKLLLKHDEGRFTTLFNLGIERDVGKNAVAGNAITSAINTRLRWLPQFEPGIELQSDYGTWGDHNPFNEQQHYLGPVAYGTLLPQTLPGLKYDMGYLFGITEAAASGAARVHLEYEMHF